MNGVRANCRACALGAFVFAASIVCGVSLAGVRPQAKQTKSGNAAPRSTAGRSLHLIGEKISKAVLDKDIPALLAYDRADLRSADEVSLKNTKSDLYCYIFDSECITWGSGNWRSVYDKLSQAHPLEIKASVTSSPYDRQLYGSLFFYDAAAASEKDLRSPDFLCKQGPANIVSWKFRFENGRWRAVTPLFDSETRGPCPNDVQGADE
jgi:hypothetical protein